MVLLCRLGLGLGLGIGLVFRVSVMVRVSINLRNIEPSEYQATTTRIMIYLHCLPMYVHCVSAPASSDLTALYKCNIIIIKSGPPTDGNNFVKT